VAWKASVDDRDVVFFINFGKTTKIRWVQRYFQGICSQPINYYIKKWAITQKLAYTICIPTLVYARKVTGMPIFRGPGSGSRFASLQKWSDGRSGEPTSLALRMYRIRLIIRIQWFWNFAVLQVDLECGKNSNYITF
jgi:hypothetical protein